MPLYINGETVSDQLIEHEMAQMREEYQRLFPNRTQEEQESQLQEWAKENLVEKVLIRQQAAQSKIKVASETLNQEFEKLQNRWDSKTDFYSDLKQQNKTPEALKFDLLLQLKTQKFVENIQNGAADPSQHQIRRYYKEHPAEFIIPVQVHARHIVAYINDQVDEQQAYERILKAKAELDAGKSFEKTGNKYSDCPGKGLDLGYFSRGKMVPAFENVVFNLKQGEISQPFLTEFGYHIAKIIDKKPRQILPLEMVQDSIYQQLLEEARTKILEKYLDEIKKTAEIKFSPPPLKLKKITKPLSYILIKPAGPDCNMACEYCFYLKKQNLFNTKRHRMTDETLETLVHQALSGPVPSVTFAFQGGEPTLMGVEFYQKVINFQKQYRNGKQVSNTLQTNGILIDEKWAEFLRENDFLVGLSIDGPEEIHDHYRKKSGGQPSWEAVDKAAKLLMAKGVVVNSLTTVTARSAGQAKEIYSYLKSLGFEYMQFIPILETDSQGNVLPFSVSAKQYGQFLCDLFDLWQADFQDGRPATSIRLFEAIYHVYINQKPPQCTLQAECGNYLVAEHNGDVFSCDFFVEPKWKLGNVHQDELHQLLNSKTQTEFGKIKADLPDDCKSCQWLDLCRGGCPKDRLASDKLNFFCQSYQRLFEYADETFTMMKNE